MNIKKLNKSIHEVLCEEYRYDSELEADVSSTNYEGHELKVISKSLPKEKTEQTFYVDNKAVAKIVTGVTDMINLNDGLQVLDNDGFSTLFLILMLESGLFY